MSLSGQKEEPAWTETSPQEESAVTSDTTAEEQEHPEHKKEEAKENTEDLKEDEEEKETEDNDDEEQQESKEPTEEQAEEGEEKEALKIDLSCMKTLYQFRSRPTLPYLLTEYGMEDKGAPALKKKEKEKKKKKRKTFGDESGRDREKEKQMEEKQLQVLEDMKKLRDYYYDEYSTLLQNKVEQQRHDIRQRSRMMQNKISQQEELARQESHHVKRRLERQTFVSDDSFLQHIPKSDLFHIVQLQDKLIKEGTLKTQSDFDTFWERIQEPDIFYMYFKVPKSDDPTFREDFNDNASSRAASTWKGSTSTLKGSAGHRERMSPPPGGPNEGGPRALSRIAESREPSRPGTRVGHHWAITQQFPSQYREPKEKRRSSFTGLKHPIVQHKSSYLQELEKRFPKLEMPKLHCFTMNLGPKAVDPEEVKHQLNLRELEKNRKKYGYKLNKMYQLAMANAAAASRILEMHEDMDFIINGAPLKDLISDQHFYSGLPAPQPRVKGGPSGSSPVQDTAPAHPSPLEQEERAISTIPSYRSSKKSGSGKSSRKSRKSRTPKATEDQPQERLAPVALSIGEVVDNSCIVEAKCLSTLWTNYMRDAPAATT